MIISLQGNAKFDLGVMAPPRKIDALENQDFFKTVKIYHVSAFQASNYLKKRRRRKGAVPDGYALGSAQRISPADQRISGPADQRTDQRISGSADRTSGPADQRISGSADQRTSGPADQRISGSADQRISGSADQPSGSDNPTIISLSVTGAVFNVNVCTRSYCDINCGRERPPLC